MRPAPRVTMPCRSASVSLPNAMSKRSLSPTSFAIACGEEQSMRIRPSQSSGMKPNVGSTMSLTTSSSTPYRSAIGRQYATPAPPSGSTPTFRPRAADRFHVHDGTELLHIRTDVVMGVGGTRASSAFVGNPHHSLERIGKQRIGPVFDPASHAGVCGSAVRRVVLEAAVLGRVVRRRDDDAVRERRGPLAIARENGMRHHRRGRVAAGAIDHRLHAIRREDFQGGHQRRLGKPV